MVWAQVLYVQALGFPACKLLGLGGQPIAALALTSPMSALTLLTGSPGSERSISFLP